MENLEPVGDMAQSIAAATSIAEVFRSLFRFCALATPAEGIFVALYSKESGLRRCVYSASVVAGSGSQWDIEEDQDLEKFPELPLNEGPQSQAIATGRVISSPDLQADIARLPVVNTGSDVDERPPRSSLSVPLTTEHETLGAFEVQSTERDAFQGDHVPALRMAAQVAAIAVQNLFFRDRERRQYEAVLRALGLALEYRDYETKGHTDRVVALSDLLGSVLGLSEEERGALRWGAYLHDLGKVAIPDQILLKPGRLTKQEFAAIQRHTLIGAEMCRDIPFLPGGTRGIVRSHHERWDGTGYPDQLRGVETPMLARAFALVDVYDALTSERPYKPAWSHEAAWLEMRSLAGQQFDPEMIEAFAIAVRQFLDAIPK